MLKETAEALKASGYNVNHYAPLKVFELGSFVILPIPANHDVPCSSFLLRSRNTGETLLFATDTAYLRHKIPNINYAMIECNYELYRLNESADRGKIDIGARDRILSSHMELNTTIGILNNINQDLLKEIYILHLSGRHADAKTVKQTIERKFGKPVYIAGE
jgi:hypothetical protein